MDAMHDLFSDGKFTTSDGTIFEIEFSSGDEDPMENDFIEIDLEDQEELKSKDERIPLKMFPDNIRKIPKVCIWGFCSSGITTNNVPKNWKKMGWKLPKYFFCDYHRSEHKKVMIKKAILDFLEE